MSVPHTLVMGEALIDRIVRDGVSDGEHVGGSPANVAIGLAQLDHPAQLATHLGQDARGQRIERHLSERGVELAPGSVRPGATSVATAHLDTSGAATYDFDLAWELPELALTGVGHIHTGSIGATLAPGGEQVLRVLREAHPQATISYDPNPRPTIIGSAEESRPKIEALVAVADVVKASDEDVAWLYDGASPEEIAQLWSAWGPRVVVITRGGAGALVQVSGREAVTVAVRPVQVADTVGAGDSFMAGLISGLLDHGLLGGAHNPGPQARQRLAALARDSDEAAAEDEAGVLTAVERAIDCGAATVERAGAYAPTRDDLHLRP